MLFAIVFFLNSAANFVFGIALSALLGPAEFGRYSTVALAALTMGLALFDWLRLSSLRFSGDSEGRVGVASALDAGYFTMMAALFVGVGAAMACGLRFGLSPALLALMPLLAVAFHRVDYAGAQLRARDQSRAFAALYGLRQAISFVFGLVVAYVTRDSVLTIAALAISSLIASIALGPALRTPGAGLRGATPQKLRRFLVYAKPIVASLVIYQLVSLVNRQAALDRLGAAATGELSLASDLGQRLFQAINTLPEVLLFQYALMREREQGRAAAQRQIAANIALAFAVLAPLTAGYMAMAPTFEALLVPSAYRGDFARLSVELAPGFLFYYLITSSLNPIFQLAQRTWPLTLAALGALLTDFALLQFADASRSIDTLANAYAISVGVGFAIAAAIAFRDAAVRPRMRDLAIIGVATLAMAFAVRPLNALSSHALAAALAVIGGGALYGAILLLCDVAGLRVMAAAWLDSSRGSWATALRPDP